MNTRDLEAQIFSIYGEVEWTRARGILHVVAIADTVGAVIAIGPAAPRSPTDRFVLGLARARSDLILTTGAILRSEPMLQHCYAEDEETNASFAAWRRQTLGLDQTPGLCVVSRSGDIAWDHPALRVARAGMVWTSKAGRERLGSSVGRLSVEEGILDGDAVAGVEPSMAESVGALLRATRSRFHAQTILIEAGPTLFAEFYRGQSASLPRLDELLLSRFEGAVEKEATGPQFEPIAAIQTLFPDAPTSLRIEEPSGVWRFERFRVANAE